MTGKKNESRAADSNAVELSVEQNHLELSDKSGSSDDTASFTPQSSPKEMDTLDPTAANSKIRATLRGIEAAVPEGIFLPEAQINENLKEALKLSDKLCSAVRPKWPWSLDAALRYAVDEPSVRLELLENAFRDFLKVCPLDAQREDERSEILRINDAVETTKRIFEGLLPSETEKISIDSDLQNWQNRVGELQAAETYRATFSPGSQAPSSLESSMNSVYALYWSNSTDPQMSVFTLGNEAMLRLLTTGFRDFWETHKAEYVRIHAAAKKEMNARTKAKSQNGTATAVKKEHKLRTAQTNAFIASHYFRSASFADDEVKNDIEQFSRNLLSSKEAREKLEHFLGSVLSAAVHDTSAETVVDSLRGLKLNAFRIESDQKKKARILKGLSAPDRKILQAGQMIDSFLCFRGLTVETARECITLMRTALDPKTDAKIKRETR